MSRWFVLLVSLVVLMLGCASEPGPLWADPGVIRFDPERVEVDVEIHNISGTNRPIGEFALTGEDWGSLRFVDDSHPRTVPVDGSVTVRLAVSRASFRSEPGVYRSGRASLRFSSNKHEYEVPIEFVGTEARRPSAPPPWLAITVLALLGLAAVSIPRRGAAEPGLLTRLASPSSTTTRERLGVAGALAALLLLVASIPFGPSFCRARAGARVGPAELEQCREGLGGFELTLLPADPGVWWWLIALAVAAGLLAVVRFRGCPKDPAAAEAEIALSLVRLLGFAFVLASLSIGLAPTGASPVDLVLAQLRSVDLGGLQVPAWGIVAQPIACVVTVALAASLRRASEPMHATLERLDRLIWAALISTLFLGGWTIPGLSGAAVPPLSHGAMLAAELGAFAVKLALVDLALRQLGALLERRRVTATELLRAHARWTLAIALANLIAVALWRLR